MPDNKNQEELKDTLKQPIDDRTRVRIRRAIRESRKEAKAKDPLRGLFWGLLLVLLGVLLFVNEQNWLNGGTWWEIFLVGLGLVFMVDALFHYLNPISRPYTPGRLSPGIILTAVGLTFLFGFTQWWPIALVATGVALLFSSWVLQREIERRTSTQATLQQSEIRYRQIIDNANSIIMEIDTHGDITFINKFACDFFGYKQEELIGHNAKGTILPFNFQAVHEQDQMLAEIGIHPERYLHVEKENILHNGNKAWIVWTYKPIYDANHKLSEILCIGIDSTEKKKTDDYIAQQLKERTAMEERNRLARDLHDAVSQTLFSASIIADVLPKLWERNPEEGRRRLEEIRQLTRGALAEMRTLLLELRPVALKDAELGDLIKQLGESITGRARIPVKVEIDGRCDLESDVKTALYRIAQEALNNVAKHSGASQATVNLHCRENSVVMSIRDNGKGFEKDDVRAQSLGLGIMQERAREINAQIDVESQLNQGTVVTIQWNGAAGPQNSDKQRS
jgi:PAS domain S-box-containing protein